MESCCGLLHKVGGNVPIFVFVFVFVFVLSLSLAFVCLWPVDPVDYCTRWGAMFLSLNLSEVLVESVSGWLQ